jgi:acyl-CoA synthetase (AMP-forming)/AMP-acid ligase II
MSYRAKSDSSSGLGLIVTLLLLCMGGTVVALQSQTRQPARAFTWLKIRSRPSCLWLSHNGTICRPGDQASR